MHPIDLKTLLDDMLPMVFGSSVGAVVGLLLFQRKTDAEWMRSQLGSSINDFAGLSSEQLNSALAAAGSEHRQGLRILRPMLAIVLIMSLVGLSVQVFRQGFPEQPLWYGYSIAGALGAALSWPMTWLERRAVRSGVSGVLRDRGLIP
ncbi:MAG: hypothetical protein EOP88_18635 [Verrucomicrobiaceae bacterium]|nr:MAG: hypothetical protein EOP88_18635 [Verrucomicrobiaceae bacterium]